MAKSLALLLGMVALSVASEFSYVATVDEGNFEATIASGDWLVEFYAPWCGHCKALAPIWEKTAETLAAKGSSLKLAKCDATVNTNLKSKYAAGFPSLRLFRDGELLMNYDQARTQAALLQFEGRLTLPAVERVASADAFKKYCFSTSPKRDPSKEGITFMLALPAGSRFEGPAYEGFKTVAEKMKTTHFFAATATAEVASLALGGASAGEAVVVRVEEDEDPTVYEGDLTDDLALAKWIVDQSVPVLTKLGVHNFGKVSRTAGKMLVMGIVNFEQKQRADALVEALHTLARPRTSTLKPEVRAKFNFGYLDGVRWEKFVEQFNVELETLPRIVVLDSPNSMFYEDPAVDEEDEIDTFLNEITMGKVQAQYEGVYGLPSRTWRRFLKWWPWSLLVAVAAVVAVPLLGWIVCKVFCGDWEDDLEAEAEAEAENTAEATPQESKKEQ